MKRIAFGLALALFVALVIVVVAAAHTPQPQVGICHATNGDHPFNSQTVNANSTAGGHDGHGDDIIPVYQYLLGDTHTEHRHWVEATYRCPPEPYTNHDHDLPCRSAQKSGGHYHYADRVVDVAAHWGNWTDGECGQHGTCEERTVPPVYADYPGKNLTTDYNGTTGAEVLGAGCVVPIPPTPTPEPTPTEVPTLEPTLTRTEEPTVVPTEEPTLEPTPTATLEATPTDIPTLEPTPTEVATLDSTPTLEPTAVPTVEPTPMPTTEPTLEPTAEPTVVPTLEPTPEVTPTEAPTPEPTAEATPLPPAACDSRGRIWVWDLQSPRTGRWYHLRDLYYDGTYDAPGLAMQRYYLGCDWYPARVWGHYVTDCDVQFNYWSSLPVCSGGGVCPLP